MTETVLRIDHLTAGYAGIEVIRDVGLDVARGEVVALLGPNGAGKTTTLRAISALVRASSGSITMDGQDLAPLSPAARARRGIAHVPEDRGLFRGLTVAEHLRLGPRGERIDADAAYGYFPALRPIADRRAGVLSGGEQQMLAVGRALARKPSVLLLDELSMGLAPVIVERLLPVIRAYADDSKCAVLLVEQHVHLALEISDRAYLMAHGACSASHDAAELRRDRAIVAASYLGGAEWSTSTDQPPQQIRQKGSS